VHGARRVLEACTVAQFLDERKSSAEHHWQGLTLLHFSAQLELCLSQENTLHTPNTP